MRDFQGIGKTTLARSFVRAGSPPWFENLGKRQVKAPKIYFRDCGLLHELLGIESEAALLAHPGSGASWEAFALEQMLRIAAPDEAWFWATHAGAELDLLMIKDGRRVGVEFKRMDAPRMTPSMRTALHDLRLQALYIVYRAIAATHLPKGWKPCRSQPSSPAPIEAPDAAVDAGAAVYRAEDVHAWLERLAKGSKPACA